MCIVHVFTTTCDFSPTPEKVYILIDLSSFNLHQFINCNRLWWERSCSCLIFVYIYNQYISQQSVPITTHFASSHQLDTTVCDKVCQRLAAGQWFSPISSTNKTDRHDITVSLLKVVLVQYSEEFNFCDWCTQ